MQESSVVLYSNVRSFLPSVFLLVCQAGDDRKMRHLSPRFGSFECLGLAARDLNLHVLRYFDRAPDQKSSFIYLKCILVLNPLQYLGTFRDKYYDIVVPVKSFWSFWVTHDRDLLPCKGGCVAVLEYNSTNVFDTNGDKCNIRLVIRIRRYDAADLRNRSTQIENSHARHGIQMCD